VGEDADLTEEVRLSLLLCLVTPLLGPVYRLFVVLGRCEDAVKDERVEAGIEEVVYCDD